MLNLKDFPILDRTSIKMLRGGMKRNWDYFIAITDRQNSDCVRSVIHAPLRNQMGSQRSPSYPDGYELFDTPYGLEKFDIAEFEFRVPRISFQDASPFVTKINKPARILDSRALSYFQRSLLMKESKKFKLQCGIRQLSSTTEIFLVSFDLLGGKKTSTRFVPGTSGELKSLTDEFEVILSNVEDSELKKLLQLLKIPDPHHAHSSDSACSRFGMASARATLALRDQLAKVVQPEIR